MVFTVITSYSIHYTKLYELDDGVRIFVVEYADSAVGHSARIGACVRCQGGVGYIQAEPLRGARNVCQHGIALRVGIELGVIRDDQPLIRADNRRERLRLQRERAERISYNFV